MPGSNANPAHAVTPYSTLRNNFVLLVPVPFARNERSLAPAYGTAHHANCVFFDVPAHRGDGLYLRPRTGKSGKVAGPRLPRRPPRPPRSAEEQAQDEC